MTPAHEHLHGIGDPYPAHQQTQHTGSVQHGGKQILGSFLLRGQLFSQINTPALRVQCRLGFFRFLSGCQNGIQDAITAGQSLRGSQRIVYFVTLVIGCIYDDAADMSFHRRTGIQIRQDDGISGGQVVLHGQIAADHDITQIAQQYRQRRAVSIFKHQFADGRVLVCRDAHTCADKVQFTRIRQMKSQRGGISQ